MSLPRNIIYLMVWVILWSSEGGCIPPPEMTKERAHLQPMLPTACPTAAFIDNLLYVLLLDFLSLFWLTSFFQEGISILTASLAFLCSFFHLFSLDFLSNDKRLLLTISYLLD